MSDWLDRVWAQLDRAERLGTWPHVPAPREREDDPLWVVPAMSLEVAKALVDLAAAAERVVVLEYQKERTAEQNAEFAKRAKRFRLAQAKLRDAARK